jgi:hypothetical protein
MLCAQSASGELVVTLRAIALTTCRSIPLLLDSEFACQALALLQLLLVSGAQYWLIVGETLTAVARVSFTAVGALEAQLASREARTLHVELARRLEPSPPLSLQHDTLRCILGHLGSGDARIRRRAADALVDVSAACLRDCLNAIVLRLCRGCTSRHPRAVRQATRRSARS